MVIECCGTCKYCYKKGTNLYCILDKEIVFIFNACDNYCEVE